MPAAVVHEIVLAHEMHDTGQQYTRALMLQLASSPSMLTQANTTTNSNSNKALYRIPLDVWTGLHDSSDCYDTLRWRVSPEIWMLLWQLPLSGQRLAGRLLRVWWRCGPADVPWGCLLQDCTSLSAEACTCVPLHQWHRAIPCWHKLLLTWRWQWCRWIQWPCANPIIARWVMAGTCSDLLTCVALRHNMPSVQKANARGQPDLKEERALTGDGWRCPPSRQCFPHLTECSAAG